MPHACRGNHTSAVLSRQGTTSALSLRTAVQGMVMRLTGRGALKKGGIKVHVTHRAETLVHGLSSVAAVVQRALAGGRHGQFHGRHDKQVTIGLRRQQVRQRLINCRVVSAALQ